MKVETRLIPLNSWEKFHPWPSATGLRWLVYKSDKGTIENFRKCFKRVNSTILIDEEEFFKWVDEEDKNNKKNPMKKRKK